MEKADLPPAYAPNDSSASTAPPPPLQQQQPPYAPPQKAAYQQGVNPPTFQQGGYPPTSQPGAYPPPPSQQGFDNPTYHQTGNPATLQPGFSPQQPGYHHSQHGYAPPPPNTGYVPPHVGYAPPSMSSNQQTTNTTVILNQPSAASQPQTVVHAVPSNHMLMSWLVCLFCCWPLGIAAIVTSSGVDGAVASGNYPYANQLSQRARTLATLAIVFGLIIYITIVVYYVSV